MSENNLRNREFVEFFTNYKGESIVPRTISQERSTPYTFDVFKLLKSVVTTDLTNICLPVFLNEPLSATQKAIEPMKYHELLNKACDQKDIVDRLAYIAVFRISTCCTAKKGRERKPFNSLLGETFEFVDIENKILAICEQVSHHPPITACQVQTENWELSVNLLAAIKFLITKITIEFKNKTIFTIKSNEDKYTLTMPKLIVHDITSDEAWCEYKGVSTIQHCHSNARVDIKFSGCSKYSNENCVTASIFDAEGKVMGSLEGNYLYEIFYHKCANEKISIFKTDYDKIHLTNFYGFNNFSFSLNDPSYKTECPTDSRYRGDIRLLEIGAIDDAEKEKKRLEAKQRAEEKNQKSQNIVHQPIWFKKIRINELNEEGYVYQNQYWAAKLNGDFSK